MQATPPLANDRPRDRSLARADPARATGLGISYRLRSEKSDILWYSQSRIPVAKLYISWNLSGNLLPNEDIKCQNAIGLPFPDISS